MPVRSLCLARVLFASGCGSGVWEPTCDDVLWQRERRLHPFHQVIGDGDGETLENFPPQTVSILEWKP
jgi:hypothetical protein